MQSFLEKLLNPQIIIPLASVLNEQVHKLVQQYQKAIRISHHLVYMCKLTFSSNIFFYFL